MSAIQLFLQGKKTNLVALAYLVLVLFGREIVPPEALAFLDKAVLPTLALTLGAKLDRANGAPAA